MLVINREVYKGIRKRKREYAPHEVSKEEAKEYQEKKLKPINYGKNYDRNESWNNEDKS